MSGEDAYRVTDRTRVKRSAGRAAYDKETVHSILDEAYLCHVGYVDMNGQPFVIPTAYARVNEKLYLHGAASNYLLKTLKTGAPVCVTVTLMDGLVLARATFHHSFNYRSCVILGSAEPVTDMEEKRAALEALVEHIVPGRYAEARNPTTAELTATSVVSLTLSEVSAKCRIGGPKDDKPDMSLPVWAGVLPFDHIRGMGQPQPDPLLAPGIDVPPSVANYARPSVELADK